MTPADPFTQGVLAKLAEHGILGIAVIFLIYVVTKQYDTITKLNTKIQEDSEANGKIKLELQKEYTKSLVEIYKESSAKLAEVQRELNAKIAELQRDRVDDSNSYAEKSLEMSEVVHESVDKMAKIMDRAFPMGGPIYYEQSHAPAPPSTHQPQPAPPQPVPQQPVLPAFRPPPAALPPVVYPPQATPPHRPSK